LPSFEELAAILLQIRSESLAVGDQLKLRAWKPPPTKIFITLPDDSQSRTDEILLLELARSNFLKRQRLQSNGSEKDVEVAQRVAHTLKGCANTVGIKELPF
jgi:chemosensory pili system protein ChpA (sensor histidine kinase/response regulator)